MTYRVRTAAADENPSEPLYGEVEADESYIGGHPKNKHLSARKNAMGREKTPVFGMIERGGRVVAEVMPAKEKHALPALAKHVAPGSTLYTDSYAIYDRVSILPVNHFRINHLEDNFRVGPIYTNTIENFWSCLKRTLKGTYISVRPWHLIAYVQEQVFRFNVRKRLKYTEEQRFSGLLEGTTGKRLTWAELITR